MENLQYFIKIYVEIKREENFVNIRIKLNYLHCIYDNETLKGFLLLIFFVIVIFIVVVNIVLCLNINKIELFLHFILVLSILSSINCIVVGRSRNLLDILFVCIQLLFYFVTIVTAVCPPGFMFTFKIVLI